MSLMKKAIGGSIHRIREFELEKVNLIDEFDILQIVGEGWFGKILLTEHRSTQTEMVLKALPKAYTGISDFFREFHYGLHLAAHRNIITTYDVAFETAGFYVFSQEYAPLGDLTSNVTETGLGELHAKRVARQLAAAVHHIHSRELVHRDIKLDNILVFRSDFSRIKLCDFGETRRVNTVVRRHNEWLPYSPPEVLQLDTDETYKALTSHDVWQFGIVLFVCLTGCLPWQKAAMDDPRYTRYQNWHNATLNIAKKPKLFQLISSRAQRMFKRLLDPKAEKRPVSVLEVNKYLEDRWLAKLGAEKALNGGADERDELCPSMYSFHSSLEEKNQLLYTLTTYGIETTVDRSKKKDRIRQWIQSSAIVEENEEEESDFNEESELPEDEDEEPPSMRGRHFPERRPSPRTDDVKARNGKNVRGARKRQPVKPVERKIPFAPQVAEERETIARFASFPNGDPSLAILKNGTNSNLESGNSNGSSVMAIRGDSVVSRTGSAVVSVNGQDIGNSSENSPNSSRDDSVQMNNSSFIPSSSTKNGVGRQMIKDEEANGFPKEDVNQVLRSPQIPARKHRSQTASFPIPASPQLNGNRAEPTRRSQSATALASTRVESSPLSSMKKSDANLATVREMQRSAGSLNSADSQSTTSLPTNRNERPPAAALPTAQADGQSIASSTVRRERLPGTNLPVARVEPQTTAVATGRTERSPPLGMSVASQLAMQSFNVMQGVNPSVSSMQSVNANDRSSQSPNRSAGQALNQTPMKMAYNQLEDQSLMPTYGKDAYEHYGIAQGTILRMQPMKHSSSGSGSRSVSN